MKKNYAFILSAFTLLLGFSVNAQTRYLNEIFDEVTVTSNVEYGINIGIITQTPVQESLLMDIYEPTGDTVTNRPVVILLHTGSFLPAIANGQPTGDKTDAAIAEACKRFAKKGYVALAVNYRLGWNPISTSEDVRRSTLIQAAYRSLQDVKTAVRFMRKSVAEESNPYGIGDQFAVGGYGTGGYISLSLATLNDYDNELLLPKFIDASEETIATYGQPMPYIIPSILGNFEATDSGFMPMDLDGDGIPETDVPLCIPNHVGYSSEVNMVFNAGGALPDTAWLDQGEVPIASMQNILDPDAPYAEGNVIVPTTGEFVIVAHGSQLVQELAHAYGNNDVFDGLSTDLHDATYGNGSGSENAALAAHEDLNGLFGIITPDPSTEPTPCGMLSVQNAPWDWWDNGLYGMLADTYHEVPAGTMGCLALLGNPDMSEEKGMAFADMMSDFFTPRVYAALIDSDVPVVYGCKDATACNYDATANVSDGSCYTFDVSVSAYDYEMPATVTTTANMPTYEWSFDGEILDETSAGLIPTENGEYTVTVTDDQGCSISATTLVGNVAIEEIISNNITVFPIPAKNHINIKANGLRIDAIKIYTIDGRLVMNYAVHAEEYTIERNSLNKGLYFIELDVNNTSIRKSIILE